MNSFQTAITVFTLGIFITFASTTGNATGVQAGSGAGVASFNTGNGVSVQAGGPVETFVNNDIQGNGTNGCPGCTNTGPGQ